MKSYVIVIEDEPEILTMVRDLLQFAGYRVVGLAHPDDIHTTDPANPPALFLIDLMLPSISGIELAQWLRENGYPNTPMIALSASRLMQQVARESHLFQATIAKPFDVSILLERVRECLVASGVSC